MTRLGTRSLLAALAILLALTGVRSFSQEPPMDARALIEQAGAVLDDFHLAASQADEERYFGHFAPDGVFLGTDASERWTVAAFRAYTHPHFAEGQGWTYRMAARHVDVDPAGRYAWFDEALENEKLGPCRGSGVLRRVDGTWRVVQYNLTIPIPNDLALEVAERIRRHARGE